MTKVRNYATAFLVGVVATLGGVVALLPKPATVTVTVPVGDALPTEGGVPFVPATGWVPDPAAVAQTVKASGIPDFGQTPAGRAVQTAEADVYRWRDVRKAAGLDERRYTNVNQRDVGCCVGCGWKHAVDVLLANQIANGQRATFKPVSVEVIYGLSRVEIGGGRLRGDGSVGAWAAAAVSKYGVVPMEKVGGTDLGTFDPYRARTFGSRGVPADVEAVAKEFPVKGTALVKSWADVQKAISQGYPVAVCSDQGFTMQRDGDGFARPSGTWNHCMCIIGVRGGKRPGGFVLNSWGDQAHTGGVFPADMPVAGFWAEPAVIDRMVRQGDSFALSEAAGFPARQPDFFARRLESLSKTPGAALALAW